MGGARKLVGQVEGQTGKPHRKTRASMTGGHGWEAEAHKDIWVAVVLQRKWDGQWALCGDVMPFSPRLVTSASSHTIPHLSLGAHALGELHCELQVPRRAV